MVVWAFIAPIFARKSHIGDVDKRSDLAVANNRNAKALAMAIGSHAALPERWKQMAAEYLAIAIKLLPTTKSTIAICLPNQDAISVYFDNFNGIAARQSFPIGCDVENLIFKLRLSRRHDPRHGDTALAHKVGIID